MLNEIVVCSQSSVEHTKWNILYSILYLHYDFDVCITFLFELVWIHDFRLFSMQKYKQNKQKMNWKTGKYTRRAQ